MGLGVVAGHRCTATQLGSYDTEPDVRERRDGPGSAADCHRGGPVQNHEGKRSVAFDLGMKEAGNRVVSVSFTFTCCVARVH